MNNSKKTISLDKAEFVSEKIRLFAEELLPKIDSLYQIAQNPINEKGEHYSHLKRYVMLTKETLLAMPGKSFNLGFSDKKATSAAYKELEYGLSSENAIQMSLLLNDILDIVEKFRKRTEAFEGKLVSAVGELTRLFQETLKKPDRFHEGAEAIANGLCNKKAIGA